VNLYPFEETVAREAPRTETIEMIDVGGTALIRAAAKNHSRVAVVGEPSDYAQILEEIAYTRGTRPEHQEKPSARAFPRIRSFLPYASPGVWASLLWGFLYRPATSPGYYILNELGMSGPQLLSGHGIYVALANIAVWGGTGFNMIVIYTSLRSVSPQLYEAARLDGASELQIALRIKIPLVLPSLVLTFFFSMIATLQVFAEPTTLAPMTNSISSTWSPLMKVYRDAFVRGDIYSASATSVVIAAVTLALSFGFLKAVGRRAYGEDA